MADGPYHPPEVTLLMSGISEEKSCPGQAPFGLWTLAVLMIVFVGCGRNTLVTDTDFSGSNVVSIVLANPIEEHGLKLIEPGKEFRGTVAKMNGIDCLRFKRSATNGCFIWFRIDPSFKSRGLSNVTVSVEFFDASFGQLEIEYDGNDGDVPDRSEKGKLRLVVYQHGEYTASEEHVQLQKTQQWKTDVFHLRDVRFQNAQHGNADFRIRARAPEIFLRKLSLQQEGSP
jgi:hypothetical protein